VRPGSRCDVSIPLTDFVGSAWSAAVLTNEDGAVIFEPYRFAYRIELRAIISTIASTAKSFFILLI
jgi:hypothetical protein